MIQRRTREHNRWISTSKVGDISGTLTTYLRRKAKERNLVWELSEQYLWDLFVSQEAKCALSGVPITLTTVINKHHNLDRSKMTASLDRIDVTLGYVEGNVQWTHKLVNIMRQSMSIPDFVTWCTLIVNNFKGESN